MTPFMLTLALMAASTTTSVSDPSLEAPPEVSVPSTQPADGEAPIDVLLDVVTVSVAGGLGTAVAGGVLAIALAGATFSSVERLPLDPLTPLLLLSIGMFGVAATPVGFVLTASALARVSLWRAIGAAVLAPTAGVVSTVVGGGLGLVAGLIATQVLLPEEQLRGGFTGSLYAVGALSTVAFSAATGAALLGGLGGGLGAAGGYLAGLGGTSLLAGGESE